MPAFTRRFLLCCTGLLLCSGAQLTVIFWLIPAIRKKLGSGPGIIAEAAGSASRVAGWWCCSAAAAARLSASPKITDVSQDCQRGAFVPHVSKRPHSTAEPEQRDESIPSNRYFKLPIVFVRRSKCRSLGIAMSIIVRNP